MRYLLKNRARLLSITIGLILTVTVAQATTYYSIANGNWNANSTWSLSSNGGAVGSGVFPVAGDDIIIERGFNVTVTANAACRSIQLAGTASSNGGTLTFSGSVTLNVSTAVLVGNSGNAARDGLIIFSGGSTMTVGSLTLGGTSATPGQGTIDMSAGGTLSIGGTLTVGTGSGTWIKGTGTVIFTATNTLPSTIFTSFNNLQINGGITTTSVNLTAISALTIGASGTFTTAAAHAITATNITVNGIYNNGSTGTLTVTNLIVNGTWNHNTTSVALPKGSSTSTWNAASNLNINGFTGTALVTNFIGQTFGNVTYNCTGQTGSVDLVQADGTTTIQGNFTVSSTGTAGTAGTLYLRFTGPSNVFSGTLNIAGNFILSGGTLDMNNGGGTASTTTINLSGNFNMSGGILTESTTSASTLSVFNFTKSGVQTFTKTGGLITSTAAAGDGIQFNVSSGSVLDMGTYVMDGTNQTSFTLAYGAGIITANTGGLVASGAAGSIQVVGTRSFSTGANYTYNGSSVQAAGTGLPATVNNLTISNSTGVTLNGAKTINGTLAIAAGGKLNNSTFISTAIILTLSGTTQANGSYGSSSSIATNKSDTYFAGTGYISAGAIPPTNLSYTSPNSFAPNVAITPLTPTVTGTVVSYSVSPSLPTGLSLNSSTGIISGTPTVSTATATYTVSATNTGGSATFPVVITVGTSKTSAATGLWSATATWVGGVVPGAGDNVTILANHTVTVDISNAVCLTLSIAPITNNTSTVTFNSGTKLTVYGIVKLGDAVNINRNGALTMTSGGILTCQGLTIANVGTNTFTPGTGTIELTATNTIPATIFTSFNNLIISGGTTTTQANLTVGGVLTVGAGATFATGTSFTLGVTGASSINGTLTLAGTGTKTFTGDVSINSTGVWNETGIAAINYAGNLTNNGSSFTTLSGIHTFSGAAKTISGTGAISIATATFTGAYANSATLTVPTLLTVTGVTLTNNGTITASTALSGTGSLTQGSTGVLNLAGTYGITTLTASAAGNTVNYTGTAQIIRAINYYHLTLSGSGTNTLQTGTTSIGGNLTLSGTVSVTGVTGLTIGGDVNIGTGNTFTAGSFTHNVAGNWTKTGTFTAAGSTINFNGSSAQNIGASNFNNIAFNGAGTKTATGALAITGSLTIATNFSGGSYLHTLQGDWTNNGTFTANSGTVSLVGANTQIIGGTSPTTFNGLTMSGSNGATLGIATSVAGTLTLTAGKIDVGNFNLIITSSGSISGGSATSYVKTSGTGRLKQTVPGVGGSKIYPVGNSAYNPMTVQYNNINTSENFSIRVADGAITNANSTKTVNRKWYLIEDAAGTSNLTLTATYNSGEEGTGFSNSSSPQIGYFDGTSWAYRPITSGSGTTTFTAAGSAPDFTNTSGFFVFGSGDAFNATKLVVTNINPANPSLGAVNTSITIQSQNSNSVPVMVTSATGFSLAATNTIMSPATPTGTIAQNTYQTVVPSIAFTTSTYNTGTSSYNHNATITVTQTSGEALTAGISSAFDVLIGAIYEPVATENWDVTSGWRKSTDGGTTWTNPATLPGSNIFAETDVIRIPSGIILTANVTASFYSMLVYGTLDINTSGALTLNHAISDVDYNITVSGTLKNSGGILTNSNPSYPLTFQGGTYLHNMNGGSIPVSTWSTLGSTLSTCNVTGITSTALTGGLNQTFQNFTWNNASQSVAQNLSADMTVNGILTLTAGIITTGSYHVIVGLNGTASNSGAGYINGFLRRYVANTVTTGDFPVGDATHYAPFSIAVNSGTPSGNGYLDVSTTAAQPPAASGLSQTKYINRKWTISNNGVAGITTYNPSFIFTSADEIGSPTIASLKLRKLTISTWYTTNGTATGLTISATGLPTAGLTATSDFYVGEDNCSSTTAIWLGSTSTDWNNATNWCSGSVPTETTDVTIPSSPSNQPVIGSAGAICNNITIGSGAGLTISGAYTLDVKANWSNSGTFTAGTGTVSFTGSSPQTITGVSIFNNLTVNNSTGVTAASNITVDGVLTLASANPNGTHGTLDMSTYILSMLSPSANVSGTGDVTGIVKRHHTFTPNTPYQFGSQYTTLNFMNSGTQPDEISCRIVIGSAPTWKTGAVSRYYSFSQTGLTGTDHVVSNLRYLDSELNSNTGSNLVLWDHHSDGTIDEHGKTNNSATNLWVGISGLSINYFAPTTLDNKQWGLANSAFVKNTWSGATNTDWNEVANWTGGHVPYATDDVLIPDVSTNNFPVLASNVEIKTLEIASGASLTAGAYDLTINGFTGAWQNNGIFDPGTGTVILTHGIITDIVSVSGTTQFNNITIAPNTFVRPGTGTIMKIAGQVMGDLSCVVDLSSYGNTIEYNGGDQFIVNPSTVGYTEKGYYNLIISGTGTKTLYGGNELDISGDFTNNGTLDLSTANVYFIGTSPQTINNSNTFNNLTVSNAAGVTAIANQTVNGVVDLPVANPSPTKGALDMSTYILDMGPDATNTGTGDVTGITRRNYQLVASKLYTFGHPDNTLIFNQKGTLPTTMSVNMSLGATQSWKPGSILRINRMTESGNSGTNASIKMHYLDSELNGNDENKLVPWIRTGAITAAEITRSDFDPVNNFIIVSNLDINFPAGAEYTLANTEITSFTWTGLTSTDWNIMSNWSGNIVPGSNSNVIIPDANTTPNVPSLPATATLSTISIQNGGILNAVTGAQLTLTGTSGTWDNNGVFNANTSTIIFAGATASVTGSTDFFNLTINANTSLATGIGSVIGIAGAVTNNGIWSVISGGATTVNYNGAAQTVVIPDPATNSYYNLILSGSGTKTMPSTLASIAGDFTMSGSAIATLTGALSIAGNVTLDAGTNLTAGLFTHTVSGNWTNNGTSFTSAGSTINFNGTAPQTIGGTSSTAFNGLTVSNTTGVTDTKDLTLAGTLNLTSNSSLYLEGNLTNNGTVNLTVGTVVFSGSAAQTISGTSPSFNNLTISNAAGVIAATDLAVNGVLNLASANPSSTSGALELVSSWGTYPTLYADCVSKILTMGYSSTTTGQGDVTGKIYRSAPSANTSYTFGNQFTTVAFMNPTTVPLNVTVVVKIGVNPSGKPDAVQRMYEITPNSLAAGGTVTANFHYLDSELNSNTETKLTTWDFDIGVGSSAKDEHGRADYDFSNNFVGLSNVPMSYFIYVAGTGNHDWRTIFTLGDYLSDHCVWNGSVSTAWNTTANWTPNTAVPSDISHVIIPDAGTTNFSPALPAGSVTINTMTIELGGILTMNSDTILIKNTLSGGWEDQNPLGNNPGTSRVVFLNPGAAVSGNARFYDVMIANGADLTNQSESSVLIANTISKRRPGTTAKWYAGIYHNTVEYNGAGQTVLAPDDAYYNLVISGSGTKILPSSSVSLKGNFTNNGITSVDATGNTLTLNGISVQTLGGTSPTTFNSLTVNNPSGITLSANETVGGALTLTSGIITTDQNTLTSLGTISGATSDSYVNGRLAQVYTGPGPVSKTFPIGKGGFYRPLTLNYTTLTGSSTVTAEQFESGFGGTVPSNYNLIGTRYWAIIGSAGTYNLTVDATGLSTPNNTANVKLLQFDGSTLIASNTAFSSPNYTSTGLTSFGQYILGEKKYSWLGTTADWATTTNWDSGILPTQSDNVLIPAIGNSPIISATTSASTNNLEITSGASLTIEAGGALKVFGNLSSSSTLVINSDAVNSGSLIVLGSSSSNVTYNRWMKGGRWYIISSPVNITGSIGSWLPGKDIPTSGSSYGMATYNEPTNTWSSYFTSSTPDGFVPGKGYILRKTIDGTIPFSGTLNTGTVNKDIGRTVTGWNSVGNPYTSSIGINSGSTTANFITQNASQLDPSYAVVYYWDESVSYANARYEIINNAGVVGNAPGAVYIQAGQGFLVKSKYGGGSLTFTTGMCAALPAQILRSAQVSSWNSMVLQASSGGKNRTTSIDFRSDMTTGLDITYDAGIFKSDPNFELYTRLVDDNGVDFAIQCLPTDVWPTLSIPVGMDLPLGGEVVFSLSSLDIPVGYYPILVDKSLNISTYLKTTDDKYTATLPASTAGAGRFFITFGDGTITGMENPLNNDIRSLMVYPNPASDVINVLIEGYSGSITLQVVNIQGIVMKEFRNEVADKGRQKIEIAVNTLSKGLYMVNAIYADGSRKTERVIIGR